ncbi:hypothetical protein PO369_13470 [Phytobacter diazotrophicus]|uniref:hypothetical protein n=1 Tax=Phytobacter diazotrophicus TaxID=395631 RepID=UPI002FF924D7
MKNVEQLQAALAEALTAPENDSENARAKMATLLVEQILKFVKFDRPGGEGFDGREGQERKGLGAIVDAAKKHEYDVSERNKRNN